MKKKYEYKVVMRPVLTGSNSLTLRKDTEELEILLSRLGRDGWKFCAWNNGVMIFMREMEP